MRILQSGILIEHADELLFDSMYTAADHVQHWLTDPV